MHSIRPFWRMGLDIIRFHSLHGPIDKEDDEKSLDILGYYVNVD